MNIEPKTCFLTSNLSYITILICLQTLSFALFWAREASGRICKRAKKGSKSHPGAIC